MAFDFPASPTDGQIYTPAGASVSYTYNTAAAAWRITSAPNAAAYVFIGDTPPPSPSAGQCFWESDTGLMFVWFDDGSSQQWVQVNGTGIADAPANNVVYGRANNAWSPLSQARRNRIVNGAMQVSQENGVNPVTADGAYPADQWLMNRNSGSTISVNQGVASSPSEIMASISVSASPLETTADAGDYMVFTTPLEGLSIADFRWGTAQAQAAVITFQVLVPVAGTYWVAITNYAGSHTFLASYTVSAGEIGNYVRKTMLVPANAINAGTWPVGAAGACYVRWCFHCGAANTGVAGFQTGSKLAGPGQALGLSAAGGCSLTNVGLYLDPDATGLAPKWELPDYGAELLRCQRYYYVAAPTDAGTYRYNAASRSLADAGTVPFFVMMRTSPAGATVTAPVLENCTALLVSGNQFGANLHATVTALGSYRASGGAYAFNARM